MNKIICIILAVLFAGCYTQLQRASKESRSTPVYISPDPIIVILPQPYPQPIPHPCPPHHPVILHPAVQTTAQAPAGGAHRIRTDGSTRDNNEQRERTDQRKR